ncbi:MAG TPA: hybrid sensor histidine kinase/response regulator [Polyangia bacterium]|nr:hybrid sensor histidine kinase/response regulator [Polyangia bacterium]
MTTLAESALPTAAVLAVDDHPANLVALEAIFETLDVQLVTATSGREALQLASARAFAVILLDVVMPEMDGFEVLQKLRALPFASATPIILLTAYEFDPRDIESLQGTALVDYIVKPIASALLRAKVRALVSLYRRGEALAAKDRDIAMLAHDLQTPLASIAAGAALLQRTELDNRARAIAGRVTHTVKRMSDMVNDLTDYARAGQGPIPVLPKPVDLGELTRDVIDEYRQLDSSPRIRLEVTGDLRGSWDPNRLSQAMANLVANALNYGEGEIVVAGQEVRGGGGESTGDVVEMVVHNRGEPIPAELLPIIFNPFERGANERKGLGLGLFIVRAIVTAHGGTVDVTSSRADGTTFRIRLPRRR